MNTDIPEWLAIARDEIGVRELRGGEHPRILEYHATTTLQAKEDEVPWCSSFVNWVLLQAGVLGTNSARAASWLSWGQECKPHPGAVCVLYRQGGAVGITSSGFHVGFLVREDPRLGWTLLGGNQGDAVNERLFSNDRWVLRALRWPA